MGANAAVPRREEDIFSLRHHYDSSVGHSGLVRVIREAKLALSKNGIKYNGHERTTIEGGGVSVGILHLDWCSCCQSTWKRSDSAEMVFERKPIKES